MSNFTTAAMNAIAAANDADDPKEAAAHRREADTYAKLDIADAIRELAPKPVEIDATSVTGPGIRITGGFPVFDAAMEALYGRAGRPEAAQDATGDDLPASQPEPGQVDAPGATRCPARRWKACVDAWPDCESGEYNPACCRFPKSCSATLLDDEEASPELVVTDEPGEVGGGEVGEASWDSAACLTCGHSRMGGITLSATDYNALVQRAETAEAERDAILNELRKLASYASPGSITALLDRYTPEG